MRISDWSSDVCSSDLPGTQAGFDANAGVLTRDQQLELLDRYGHVPETVEQQRTLYRTLEGERGRQQETDARGPMATTDDALSGGEAPYSPASRAQDGPRAQQPTDAELDATGAQRPYARTATGIGELGRASCRERVCQNVEIGVVDVC